MTAGPRGFVIAIDGPSGAGKSTAGRALARRLGYTFIDTGAMYRALALRAIDDGVEPGLEEPLARLAEAARIELDEGGNEGGARVRLDGVDVTARIRSREVSAMASRVSVHPRVRSAMVTRQRELGRAGGVVLDGRDIGTAVFPDADVKFYLDADATRRARRRYAELGAAGVSTDLGLIEREIRERDHTDSTRADSPLVRAPDAVLLDTTLLSPEEVVERMIETVAARAKGSHGDHG
jgi:cytidylate kinase